MTESIETLTVKVGADVDEAIRGLNKVDHSVDKLDKNTNEASTSMQNSTGKMSKSFASVAKAGIAASAALAAAMGAISWKMITLAGDAEEVQNKFDAVFKETAVDAEQFAEQFGSSVGRATTDVKKYMSTFQDTFVPMGFARDSAEELSEQLTELAVDLASFNNEAETETVASLQSALVGNHETMRKYGVVITQAVLDQELLNMGFEGGAKNATELQKVQARLNVIMSGTSDAQGDAARTAGSFANQSRTLKSSLKGVMEEAGGEALPDLAKTMSDFNEWGTSGGYDQMVEGLGDVAKTFAAAAEAGAALTTTLVDLYGVVTIQDIVLPEGMAADMGEFPHSGTMSITSDFMTLSLEEQRQIIRDNVSAFGEAFHIATETGSEIDDQNTSLKEQLELLTQGSSIPSWAGHGDYIRDRMQQTGEMVDVTNEETGEVTKEWKNTGTLNELIGLQESDPTRFAKGTSLEGTVSTAQSDINPNEDTATKEQNAKIIERLDAVEKAILSEPRQVDIEMDIDIQNHSDVADFESTLARSVAAGTHGNTSI
ncbi:MAG: hypothetical protein ACXQTE_03870 [Methanosarcinaceae archaeon]